MRILVFGAGTVKTFDTLAVARFLKVRFGSQTLALSIQNGAVVRFGKSVSVTTPFNQLISEWILSPPHPFRAIPSHPLGIKERGFIRIRSF